MLAEVQRDEISQNTNVTVPDPPKISLFLAWTSILSDGLNLAVPIGRCTYRPRSITHQSTCNGCKVFIVYFILMIYVEDSSNWTV